MSALRPACAAATLLLAAAAPAFAFAPETAHRRAGHEIQQDSVREAVGTRHILGKDD